MRVAFLSSPALWEGDGTKILGHQAGKAKASVLLMHHPSSDGEEKASVGLTNVWIQ